MKRATHRSDREFLADEALRDRLAACAVNLASLDDAGLESAKRLVAYGQARYYAYGRSTLLFGTRRGAVQPLTYGHWRGYDSGWLGVESGPPNDETTKRRTR